MPVRLQPLKRSYLDAYGPDTYHTSAIDQHCRLKLAFAHDDADCVISSGNRSGVIYLQGLSATAEAVHAALGFNRRTQA